MFRMFVKISVIVSVSAVSLLAQAAAAPKLSTASGAAIQIGDVAQFGQIAITGAMVDPGSTIAGAPYSAEAVTERVQLLTDGNRIHQTTSGTVARDGQGRVRRDEGLPALTAPAGDAPHLVTIMDPVAHVHWMLDARNKIAIKMPMSSTGHADAGPVLPPPPGAGKVWFNSAGDGGARVQVMDRVELSGGHDVNKVDLGTQSIEGVPAQGTRITRTIAAGAIGNEQPIVITTETWYSPDLKVLVLSKTEDPRMGETTYKLTNIQRSEPPPDLFEVPADYTIKDQPGDKFFYRETKKLP